MWIIPSPKSRLLIAMVLILTSFAARGQRTYRDHSLLSTGNWYRIAVAKAGVYRMDPAFLNSLGLPANLASSSLRLYGYGGGMLPESNAVIPPDDLVENAILVEDGGDGVINGNDQVLFYSPGPDAWRPDPVINAFRHQKNLYSDTVYYFLTVGGTGARIPLTNATGSPSVITNEYLYRYVHELDTVNLLSSGKEWYGEEFTDAPGKTLTRSFSIPGSFLPGNPVTIRSRLIARSIGTAGRFDLKLNDPIIAQITIPATSSGAYDLFAREEESVITTTAPTTVLTLSYSYVPGSFNSQGWLNWFEIFHRKPLNLTGSTQLDFRDPGLVGQSLVEFVLSGANASVQVWEVTNPLSPVRKTGTLSGNEFRFRDEAPDLREYIAFQGYLTPIAQGRIANQDIHGLAVPDYILVTPPFLLTQANRLAQYHRQRNQLEVAVLTTTEIYQEFSSGQPDPSAIRNCLKMFYDRARTAGGSTPRFLALFGDASFDYKNRLQGNTNLVPGYQHSASLDPLSTYTSDDFFGYLDDQEDINSQAIINLLDIGIGRIPANQLSQATAYVDKVIAYHDRASLGPWRNKMTFIADDEDQNLHIEDAEIITATAAQANPLLDAEKIYLDAFTQETVSGAERYPVVNDLVRNRVINGTLIWNYSGHGSFRRLAEEVVLDQDQVNSWNNPNRLPLFITATCDFAPFDNPIAPSIGEDLLLREKTGAIALMTTTRLVFAFSNRVMNNNYLAIALAPKSDGSYRSLGEAVKEAKNFTYQNSTDIVNNRKFTLLGDPALTLGFPALSIRAERINGVPVGQSDTLSAMEKVKIEGVVTDAQGNIQTGFQGNAYTTVFDKERTTSTLGNDPGSPVRDFQVRDIVIFRGRSTVRNGRFELEFKVPRDLNPAFGNGKMSFYAEDGAREAGGYFTQFVSGGNTGIVDNDNEGPGIRAWLNDEKFVNGGISNARPVLVLRFNDSSGINTIQSGIGHDIVVTVDDDNDNYFILNDFYEADPDNYKAGSLRFQLPVFEPGPHRLRIKAWDVMNNSSEIELAFEVVDDEALIINRVLNYPNPFTTHTNFWFEHNRPGEDLRVDIQIFTISGKIIKRISQTINTPGNRSSEVEWDGRDDFGARIGRGVYLYKLRVSTSQLKSNTIIEKLVVF